MKNSKTLFREIIARISLKETPEEIQTIVYLLLEHFFLLSRTDVMLGKMIPYGSPAAAQMLKVIERINQGEPIQYVIEHEFFFGRRFHVNPSVLIPRPETEELVRVVLAHKDRLTGSEGTTRPLRVLDVGTGSGCIAITMSLELQNAEVFATDVSTAALSVASGNADALSAHLTFVEHDILREDLPFDNLDIAVSNPPYVTVRERTSMQPTVTGFEPHLALFVPNDDPLIFYGNIFKKAARALRPQGLLAVEINERFADEVSGLFYQHGFTEVVVTRDISGKDRIVTGFLA